MRCDANNHAFSLIEVNLAILMIAVGLLGLFTLFPLGLKESEKGIADTQEAMFADTILSALEGNALGITNWATWEGSDVFIPALTQGLSSRYPTVLVGGQMHTANFPNGSDKVVRYQLDISKLDQSHWVAALKVKYGRYGSWADGSFFHTEFIYLGM